jgi:hypothetical protein
MSSYSFPLPTYHHQLWAVSPTRRGVTPPRFDLFIAPFVFLANVFHDFIVVPVIVTEKSDEFDFGLFLVSA